jgi:hypothetical protein
MLWVHKFRSSKLVNTDQTRLASLSECLRRIPDQLFGVQLDLRPLCKSDAADLREADKTIIDEACSQLHSVIADIAEIAKELDASGSMPEFVWNAKADVSARSRTSPPNPGDGKG